MLKMLSALKRLSAASLRAAVDPALRRVLKKKATRNTSQATNEDDPLEFATSLLLRNGNPYRLDDHDDLVEIAKDEARVVVVEKAAQKGVTELMIRLQFWLAKKGFSSAYFLSSLRFVRMQVQQRVDSLIRVNPILQKALVEDATPEWVQEEEIEGVPKRYRLQANMWAKRFWNAWVLYMPVQNEADVRMFPLDAIFVDEVETLKPELADALQERLYHSPLKWERWFSQPTVAGYGIDERFAMTDQRYLQFRCDKCKEWFVLEENFPKVLMATIEGKPVLWGADWDATLWDRRWQFEYCCPVCKSLVNMRSLKKEWVSKFPDRDAHGYHLTQLYSSTMTATEVAQLWHQAQFSLRRKERFYNSVLGLPYSGGERQPITPDKCFYGTHEITGMLFEGNKRYAGMDVGDTNHLIVLEQTNDGRLYIVWAEEIKGKDKWETALRRLLDLKVCAVGVNAMPYKDSAKKLLRSLPPEVKGALIYDTAGKGISITNEDEKLGAPILAISVPRVELMDGTVDAVLNGTIVLPKRGLKQTEEIVRHLMNYIIEYTEKGRDYAKGREDHFGRAIDYARIIAENAVPLKLAPVGRLTFDDAFGSPLGFALTEVSW